MATLASTPARRTLRFSEEPPAEAHDEAGGEDDPAAGIQADAESTAAVAAAAIEALTGGIPIGIGRVNACRCCCSSVDADTSVMAPGVRGGATAACCAVSAR